MSSLVIGRDLLAGALSDRLVPTREPPRPDDAPTRPVIAPAILRDRMEHRDSDSIRVADLSATAQRRVEALIEGREPGPIMTQLPRAGTDPWAWLDWDLRPFFAAGVGAILLVGVARAAALGHAGHSSGAFWTLAALFGCLSLGWAVTGIRRQLAARPTPPGEPKLLLADQLIVPGRDGLEVLSLSGLKGIRLIDERVDGRYLGTLVLFELRSGRREGFVVRNRADGLRAIRALRRARLALEQARRVGDAATLRRLDPLDLARSRPAHAPLAPTVGGAEAAPQPSPTEEAEPSSSPEATPSTQPVTPSPPE